MHRTPTVSSKYGFFLGACLCIVKNAFLPKQKRNAPHRRKTYQCIHDARHYGVLPAADPRDDIKLKNTDGTPIQSAHNRQDQCQFVQHKGLFRPFFAAEPRCCDFAPQAYYALHAQEYPLLEQAFVFLFSALGIVPRFAHVNIYRHRHTQLHGIFHFFAQNFGRAHCLVFGRFHNQLVMHL